MDTVLIHGMQCDVVIGAYASERQSPQRVEVDLELGIENNRSSHTDQLQDAIDYDSVIDQFRAWLSETHFCLLEALAEYLAQKLLATFPIQQVRLRICKQRLGVAGRRVGVEIVRNRVTG